jgi:hypothetical protein
VVNLTRFPLFFPEKREFFLERAGGTRTYLQLAPSFRPMPLISIEASYEFQDVTLPQGAFTTQVVNGRMNVNVSNTWLTTTLASRRRSPTRSAIGR